MAFKRKVVISASEDRLEQLIRDRLEPGSDKKQIDGRIWDLFGETWCIMYTDLVGFSRNTAEFGIIHFLQNIYASELILIPIIEEYDGILLKSEGDSLLIIFRKVDKALLSALSMQHKVKQYNAGKAQEDCIYLSIGLGYGKVLRIGDVDVFGSEVNSASKLGEDRGKAYDILVTAGVKDNAGLTDITFTPLENKPDSIERAYAVHYG